METTTTTTTTTTAVRARTSRPIPILHTSSETREGGAELWSILLDAVAGESPSLPTLHAYK